VKAARVAVIYKQRRALVLYLQDKRHAAYPIGLGWDPDDGKETEGDGRTPEGTYRVCTRNTRSRFHLFLGLSYPNTEDARKALKAERISPGEFRRISEANARGISPPWNTALGGEVGIHGGGAGSDWTAGCIALEDKDAEKLWPYLLEGDPVVILP
jgi:murein L,D-transpeptidase YafK